MKVTIVGLDVVGRSVGLVLRGTGTDIQVAGHDPEPRRASAARKEGAVEDTHWNLISACEGADLIWLNLPLDEVRESLSALAGNLEGRVLLMDNARLKVPALEWAGKLISSEIQFVGGHLALRPRAALAATPGAELLDGAVFYLTPSDDTPIWAVGMATDLAETVGARPVHIDPQEHDGLMASADQLPFLASLALTASLAEGPGWRERDEMGSVRLSIIAAILAERPWSAEGLALGDRSALLHWLDLYLDQLSELLSLIAGNDQTEMAARIEESLKECSRWLPGGASAAQDGEEAPWGGVLSDGLGVWDRWRDGR